MKEQEVTKRVLFKKLNLKGGENMEKYKVVFYGEEQDEVFDSE